MDNERLQAFISEKKWAILASEYSPDQICKILDFKSSMALAFDLFFSNSPIDEFQDFSVKLFMRISKSFPKEWTADWKNDAFLGNLCSITWRYDEMYKFYKKAYDLLDDPPDSLLLLLAGCNSAPGTPPLTDQEAEVYLLEAISKKVTYEAALMMRSLARNKKDVEQEKYWNHMCQDLERENIHTEMIIPDVLKMQNRT